MAQFHTTVLTLLHGSAKEAYQVAVSDTAETRRLAEAEEATVAFFADAADPPTASAFQSKPHAVQCNPRGH